MKLRLTLITWGAITICIVMALGVSAQQIPTLHPPDNKDKKVILEDGAHLQVLRLTEIPEATEPCLPQVCEWWNQIRKANADLNNAYVKKKNKSILESRERFFHLLNEGQQRGYAVPLKDRPPQALINGWPEYNYVARQNRIQGEIVLTIDVWIDGTVGNTQIIKGLGWGLDERAVKAARVALFLPTIKDHAFVAQQSTVKYGFLLGCIGCQGR
jgi:TonB family protein